jgi:pimeloyl-ACP methyl ester carboxylesterase
MPIEEINGTTIFHETSGHGEPLVLVHGAWSDHTTWDAVVPALAETFLVVAYDLRGHGRSQLEPPDAGTVHDDIADLAALIEHLELDPVNIAGISSGACIALRFASVHPSLVRRVLPHEPPCADYLLDDPDKKPLLDEIGVLLGDTAHRIETGDHRGAAQRFFDELVLLPWADLPDTTRDLAAAHAVAFLGQLRDPDAVALDPDALRSVSAPVLLSQGSTSHPFASLVVDQLAGVIPHASRVVLAGAGHVPHMTHPGAYVDMVVEFVHST